MLPVGFWGLSIDAGKTYTQEVETGFEVTMAALGAEATDGQKVTLYVRYEDTASDSESESEDTENTAPKEKEVNEFALCTLTAGRVDQQQLSLVFSVDEVITLFTRGDAKIHLSGNHVVDEADQGDMQEMYDGESQSEDEEAADEEHEEMSPETLATFRKALEEMGERVEEDDEEMHSDDFESMDDEEPEIDEKMMLELINQKRKAETQKKAPKKPKIEEIVEKKVKAVKVVEEKIVSPVKVDAKMTKKEKKAAAVAATAVTAATVTKPVKEVVTVTPPTELAEKSNKKTFPSGLITEDEVVGTGQMAKRGKKVSCRYIGKLMNGKIFDSNVKGSPFSFKLGAGEVIKGWDVGMHVGGTRKITIPAPLAYGAKGAKPDIPANAMLQFEVKLLEIR